MNDFLNRPTLRSPATSRRAFLRAGAGTAAAVWCGQHVRVSPLGASQGADDAPRRLTFGAAQTFVDLNGVEQLDGVQQLFHAAEKHPENPVLVGEKEWERKMGGPCASFIYDEDEKLFKVWYQGVYGDRRGYEHTYGPHTLNYAVSHDGVHWEKPSLGLYEVGGSLDNNVVVPLEYHNGQDHWESVLKDPADPDPLRRYKAIGWSSDDWDGPLSGIYSMTSPDGLRWTHSAEPLFRYHPRAGTGDLGPVGDAQSLMIDQRQERYVALLRGTAGNRLYSVSHDFVHWSSPEESMPAVPGRPGNTLYNHLGFNYGDQVLGFVTHYNVRADGVHNLTLRLLSSRDGLRFEFAGPDPHDRVPLVGVGEIGEWDRFMVMLTGAPPIAVGDKLYIYYRGYSETHDRSGQKPADSYYAGANGLATLRLDGFASLAAGFDRGRVTTRPILFDRPASGDAALRINAKANHFGSSVLVEALNEQGQPIAGYSADECLPMNADSVDYTIGWRSRNLTELAGRPVRLRFHLSNARLYAYRIG